MLVQGKFEFKFKADSLSLLSSRARRLCFVLMDATEQEMKNKEWGHNDKRGFKFKVDEVEKKVERGYGAELTWLDLTRVE